MRKHKIRFIVKLGLVVIAILLLGPYIFHIQLNENAKDEADLFREFKLKHKLIVSKAITNLSTLQNLETAFLTVNVFGNFEPPELPAHSGPGENGRPVVLSEEEKIQSMQSIQEFGFNMIASDKIAMNRNIPDTRLPECKHWHFSSKQPKASVILVFHNEGFSTLVRTIHSVVNTSPTQFLHEVVLVDDFSDKDHLKEPLEKYIQKEFNGLVKLFRNSQREGLIRTRTRGAELASGEVIVFLDAHCECNKNWLVPLLDRIRRNRKTMAVPIVDGIDYNTMEYTSVYGTSHNRGIFEWGFFYKEAIVPEKELKKRKHNSEPYLSPTHAGGLFAMDRNYFFELGGYDPGLRIWGGENYELSFKIWLCGGTVEWVPCSRVGHIYRNHMPYTLGKDIDPLMSPIYINYIRVVEVWMEDPFKEYFYTREPSFRGYPFGNITQQLAFKKEHKCQSFQWFMENVAYDVYDHYPAPPANKAWGEIRLKNSNLCWDSGAMQEDQSEISLKHCHGSGHAQQYRLNIQGQIGIGERCIDVKNGRSLVFTYCQTQPSGPWEWDQETGLIQHKVLRKCVVADSTNQVQLKSCDKSQHFFHWSINEIFPWKKRLNKI